MTKQTIKEYTKEKHNETANSMHDPERKNMILRERAELLKKQIEKEKDEGIQGLEFVLSDEQYFIDANYVSEVIPLKDLTPLPCTPEFILGIINVRGKIIAVNNLKKLIDLPENEITKLNRVIIVKHQDIELGILVDEIVGSREIIIDDLQTSVSTITRVKSDYLTGITNDRLIILNIEELLSDERIIINDETSMH